MDDGGKSMRRKPLIGVVPLWDDDKESPWMLPGYFDGIQQAGGLPLMLPLTEDHRETAQLASLCDGFLFTGGHDVSPSVYYIRLPGIRLLFSLIGNGSGYMQMIPPSA